MYSIKKILKQEPAAITGVVNLWLAFLCVAGAITWSGEIIAGFIAALNATLLLLYVRPLTNSRDALQELADAS